jgi:hypothetical protein
MLYQRYIYQVDYTRANEFGQVFDNAQTEDTKASLPLKDGTQGSALEEATAFGTEAK